MFTFIVCTYSARKVMGESMAGTEEDGDGCILENSSCFNCSQPQGTEKETQGLHGCDSQ